MRRRTADSVLKEYLVVQCQMGDDRAFTRLVRLWHPKLLRHAFHLTGDREAAGDITQESWMAIVRGLKTLRDPARFRAWAFRIVANKSRDWIRREQARRKTIRGLEGAPDTRGAPAGRDEGERIRAGLQELGPDHRLVLSCYYLEEMSVREIARALSVPEGTVKSRLFHARRALGNRLEEEP